MNEARVRRAYLSAGLAAAAFGVSQGASQRIVLEEMLRDYSTTERVVRVIPLVIVASAAVSGAIAHLVGARRTLLSLLLATTVAWGAFLTGRAPLVTFASVLAAAFAGHLAPTLAGVAASFPRERRGVLAGAIVFVAMLTRGATYHELPELLAQTTVRRAHGLVAALTLVLGAAAVLLLPRPLLVEDRVEAAGYRHVERVGARRALAFLTAPSTWLAFAVALLLATAEQAVALVVTLFATSTVRVPAHELARLGALGIWVAGAFVALAVAAVSDVGGPRRRAPFVLLLAIVCAAATFAVLRTTSGMDPIVSGFVVLSSADTAAHALLIAHVLDVADGQGVALAWSTIATAEALGSTFAASSLVTLTQEPTRTLRVAIFAFGLAALVAAAWAIVDRSKSRRET